MIRTLAQERLVIRLEDIRPAEHVTAALPDRAEVTAAVWGTKVSADGGPIARAIVAHLRELAELHAGRQQLDRAEFLRRHHWLTNALDAALIAGLPGLSDWTRASLLDQYDQFAELAVLAHRACRELGADDPRAHELCVRLASHAQSYTYFVAGLGGTPPWHVLDGDRDDELVIADAAS